MDGLAHTCGKTPPIEEMISLYLFLSGRIDSDPFSTKNLAGIYTPAEAFVEVASGVLYHSLGYLEEGCIV